MARAKYQYDESGGTFFYFLLSFLALVVIPSTFYFLWSTIKKNSKDKKRCHCSLCTIKTADQQKSKDPRQKLKLVLATILLIIGWIAFLACAYKVSILQHDKVTWDAYEILQISMNATELEIRKAYRKLSLLYHPDRNTGDESKFMKVAKAYASLTNEDARINLELYGNPDGPRASTFGIALPSWIVEGESSLWFLFLYTSLFMFVLPVAVYFWWSGSTKSAKDDILDQTLRLYYWYSQRSNFMTLKHVTKILGASHEFDKYHNDEIMERPTDVEDINLLLKKLYGMINEKITGAPVNRFYCIKARALIHAHFLRLELPPTLSEDRKYIVRKCPRLLQGFIYFYCCWLMQNPNEKERRNPKLVTVESAMNLTTMIIQAVWDFKSPFLQLPHVTEDMVNPFLRKKRNIHSIQQLLNMKREELRELIPGLNDEQYKDVVKCLSKMPNIEIQETIKVRGEDEDMIRTDDILTLTVKVTRKDFESVFGKGTSKGDNTTKALLALEKNTEGTSDVDNTTKALLALEENTEGTSEGDNTTKALLTLEENTDRPQEIKSSLFYKPKPKNWQKHKKNKSRKNKKKEETSEKVRNRLKQPDATDERSPSDPGDSNQLDDEGEEREWESTRKDITKVRERMFSTKSKYSHSAHCPHFPDDKQECWWIYVVDNKNLELVTIPHLMVGLVNEQEVKMLFQVPSRPGNYKYSLIVRSDSYVNYKVVKIIKLTINPKGDQQLDRESDDNTEDSDDDNGVQDSSLEDDAEYD